VDVVNSVIILAQDFFNAAAILVIRHQEHLVSRSIIVKWPMATVATIVHSLDPEHRPAIAILGILHMDIVVHL